MPLSTRQKKELEDAVNRKLGVKAQYEWTNGGKHTLVRVLAFDVEVCMPVPSGKRARAWENAIAQVKRGVMRAWETQRSK